MARLQRPHMKDPDATITGLRIVRTRMAIREGEVSSFDLPPQSAEKLVLALTDLAVSGFRRCAELEGCLTDDEIRDWVMARLDDLIEDVTLQALGSQDPGQ
jgi:hypothetical protein